MKNKKKIIPFIIYSIVLSIVCLILLFLLDLMRGSVALFFVEIAVIIGAILLRFYWKDKKFIFRFLIIIVLVVVNIAIFSFAKPLEGRKKVYDYKGVTETSPLQLKNGLVKGLVSEDGKIEAYAGIPYAKAPIGDLRWKEPVDVENWEGVKDCTTFAAKSMQPDSNQIMNSLVEIYAQGSYHPNLSRGFVEETSEDSLYLNIWRPTKITENLPIIVYIHGGSLTSGSSSFEDYNGETMARQDIIMITIAYRLGVFGYFAHSQLIEESPNNTTGNYGLLDQIQALKWVNENAEYFGGDKNNITIAGESAGSSSVSALCSSPLAKGLFKRAIGESSSVVLKNPPHTYRSLETALETGNKIMEEFNCTSIEELRKIDASKLVNTAYSNSSMTLDGYALTKSPYEVYLAGENNEEALLNGYNVKEADAFVVPTFLFSPTNKDNIEQRLSEYLNGETAKKICTLYKEEIEEDAFSVFNEIMSVLWFMYPHYSWSDMAYKNGVKVYKYQFTKENGYYGTYHSGEIIYAFNNIYLSKKQFAYGVSDYLLADKMIQYWSNFAKTGNPNGNNLPIWEEFSNNGKVLELGENISMIDERYIKLYDIISEYYNEIE